MTKGVYTLVWKFAVFSAGFFVGRFLVSGCLGRETIGVALMAAAFFVGVGPSLLVSVIGKMEREPPKEFSRFYADKFRNAMVDRRFALWRRYKTLLICLLLLGVSGAVLKFSEPHQAEQWFVAVGLGAGFLGCVLASITIVEFQHLSEVLTEIAENADSIRRRNESLR